MATTTELKRYGVVADRWDDFLEVMRNILAVRRRHGFRVVCAFVDRENNFFTWAIENSGDFDEASRAYYADPDRQALNIVERLNTWYEIRRVETVNFVAGGLTD